MPPVEDHPVHPMTVRPVGRLNWCHSSHGHIRKSTYLVKDGLVQVGSKAIRAYKMKPIKDAGSLLCHYCLSPEGIIDIGCNECKYRRFP